MSRFGSDPQAFFDAVYQGDAPWDVGGPQPALVALFDEHPPASPVLDVGCGSGDLAIALARRGLDVLGIDFVGAAIDLARERARVLPPASAGLVEFQVADALRPTLLGRRFGTVVDSGFFHLFDPDEGDRLAAEVAKTLLPGGRYYLLAFATEFDIPHAPRKVTEDELRARFTADAGWRIRTVRPAHFQSRVAPVPAIAACIERLSADEG